MVRVPLLRRYYETLRLPVVLPAVLRFLRLAVPLLASVFVSPQGPTPTQGPGTFGSGSSTTPAFEEMEVTGSPRFLENPNCAFAVFSDPGRTDASGHRDAPTWPPLAARRRLLARGNFGAQSHGFGTGCLRFARWVSPTGRKTRFWVLAKLSQAGLNTRRAPTKGFNGASYIISPSPRLRLAQAASPLYPVGQPYGSLAWMEKTTQLLDYRKSKGTGIAPGEAWERGR